MESESKPKKVIWGKIDIPEGMLQPYIVNTDLEAMKAACELCKTESCCPEHCCDVRSNDSICLVGQLPVQSLRKSKEQI